MGKVRADHTRNVRVLAAAVFAGMGASFSSADAQVTLGRNFQGTILANVGLIPPDTMGAAGVDHFVQFVNGRFAVYNKSNGSTVGIATSSDSTFWNNAGATWSTALTDPRIVYDHASGRWFATELDIPGGAGTLSNSMLIAVSNTSDPTAGFKGFTVDPNPSFADFDMLGVNADSVTISSNDFGLNGAGLSQSSWVNIPKSDLLLSTPTVANRTTFSALSNGSRGSIPQGVISYGPSTGHALMLGLDSSTSGSALRRTNINGASAGAATLASTQNTSVTPFSSPPLARQPDGSQTLETSNARISSAAYQQGDTIWMVHSTNISARAAIHWIKFSESSGALIQEGFISDPNFDFSYPSICANPNGDVVVGYTRVGTTEFAGAYASVGTTSGGVTSFASPLLLQAGAANYQVTGSGTRNRWGDYSATSLDPADPGIFWTTQEYVPSNNNWATRIIEVIIPAAGEVRWRFNVNNTFGTGSTWTGGAAPDASAHAIFSRSTTSTGSFTVTFDNSFTNDRLSVRQGNVIFNLSNMSYSLTNPSATTPSVTIGEFQSHPMLTVQSGTMVATNTAIALHPMSFGTIALSDATYNNTGSMYVGGSSTASAGAATVAINTSTLNIGGTLKIWNANSRVLFNSGSLSAGSIDVIGGQIILAAGANKVLRTGSVGVSANGKINLTDNKMVVDYDGGPSPLTTIKTLISTAYALGAWNGSGITSSLADASVHGIGYGDNTVLGLSTFGGQSVTPTSVLVAYTFYGDSNLDGQVDVTDLGALATNWQMSGFWTGGDFNYDGFVDVTDLGSLATNWQAGVAGPAGPTLEQAMASLGLPIAAVPEPSALLSLAAAGIILSMRWRKSVVPAQVLSGGVAGEVQTFRHPCRGGLRCGGVFSSIRPSSGQWHVDQPRIR